ncbi:hypothetical protein QYF36_024587 [Acer negundo]|nr:hypothetical protein QYF36_024587 [Acer negundo]
MRLPSLLHPRGWTLLSGISIADFTNRGQRLTWQTGVDRDGSSWSNTGTRILGPISPTIPAASKGNPRAIILSQMAST